LSFQYPPSIWLVPGFQRVEPVSTWNDIRTLVIKYAGLQDKVGQPYKMATEYISAISCENMAVIWIHSYLNLKGSL